MNVTFHAIAAITTASVLSIKKDESVWNPQKLIVAFISGILVHGVLDISPHDYPIKSNYDVVLAILLFAVTFIFTKKKNYLLLTICFTGAIFPDIIDLSSGIVNRHLGIPFPQLTFKVFPWHRKEYSGSIYDGSCTIETALIHILLVVTCLIILVKQRYKFFRFSN